MNPDVALRAHLRSPELAALPIAPADILDWRDAALRVERTGVRGG